MPQSDLTRLKCQTNINPQNFSQKINFCFILFIKIIAESDGMIAFNRFRLLTDKGRNAACGVKAGTPD